MRLIMASFSCTRSSETSIAPSDRKPCLPLPTVEEMATSAASGVIPVALPCASTSVMLFKRVVRESLALEVLGSEGREMPSTEAKKGPATGIHTHCRAKA